MVTMRELRGIGLPRVLDLEPFTKLEPELRKPLEGAFTGLDQNLREILTRIETNIDTIDLVYPVTNAALASGLFIPDIVGTLPTLPDTNYPDGSLVVLTTDWKLYRNAGGSWTAAVPAVDLTGTVDLNTQVSGTLTTAFAAAGLINGNVTINADGTLSGAGAGQASLTSLPGQVQAGSIAANAVTAAEIAALTITAAEIAASTITGSKIAANTITAGNIAANTITSAEIAADTITAAQIAAGAIGADELAANAVTAGKIAANAVTAGKIAANAVTASEINVSSLSAIAANMGSLTSGSIVIGSTNKIWLNDAADGALAIGGSVKASAPFRVTAAGALTATSATITGTLTASSIVQASSFTATSPVFDGSITVKGGTSNTQLTLTSNAAGGEISFKNSAGTEKGYAKMISAVGLRLYGDPNLDLQAVNQIRFSQTVNFIATTNTGRTANDEYIPIFVNGTARYLRTYT